MKVGNYGFDKLPLFFDLTLPSQIKAIHLKQTNFEFKLFYVVFWTNVSNVMREIRLKLRQQMGRESRFFN